MSKSLKSFDFSLVKAQFPNVSKFILMKGEANKLGGCLVMSSACANCYSETGKAVAG